MYLDNIDKIAGYWNNEFGYIYYINGHIKKAKLYFQISEIVII